MVGFLAHEYWRNGQLHILRVGSSIGCCPSGNGGMLHLLYSCYSCLHSLPSLPTVSSLLSCSENIFVRYRARLILQPSLNLYKARSFRDYYCYCWGCDRRPCFKRLRRSTRSRRTRSGNLPDTIYHFFLCLRWRSDHFGHPVTHERRQTMGFRRCWNMRSFWLAIIRSGLCSF